MILKKHIKLIILLILLCGFAGYSLSRWGIPPQYEADASMIVIAGDKQQNSGVTYDQITTAQQLVSTYTIVLKSDMMLNQVIRELDLRESAKSIEPSITVTGVGQSAVIDISVQNNKPQTAADIANEITKIAPEVINASGTAGSVKTISPAQKPDKPVSPNVTFNTAFSILTGLILSLILTLLIEMKNHTFVSYLDIHKYLNYPVLGIIPVVKQTRDHRQRTGGKRDSWCPIIFEHMPFQFIENYNILRTNLNLASRQSHTIVITSSIPKEGKSTVAVNLAVSLSNAGYRVLLVDCDLRSSALLGYLKIYHEVPGLTYALADKLKIEECILRLESLGVDFIPSGSLPANPAEMLGSAKMLEEIRFLSSHYDYILFDTPPVSVVTDAAVLSQYTDGTVFVIRHQFTNIESAQLARNNLENIGANVIGTVLNVFKRETNDRAFYKVSRKGLKLGYEYGLQTVMVRQASGESVRSTDVVALEPVGKLPVYEKFEFQNAEAQKFISI